ncbi:MAG: TetR/AcrR family transcriptional regulator [Actinomycetes bacterium]
MTDTPTVPEINRTTPRGDQITDAALVVLAESGGRGLTHRAVDSEAGLPQGSTSNLFRTRDALVVATLDRHVERETEILNAVRESAPTDSTTVAVAASLFSESLTQLASPPNDTLTAARFELYCEVRRRTELRARLAVVRSGYVALTGKVLERCGIEDSAANATAVLAMLEGLTVDLIFHPESALKQEQRTGYITALLESL